MRYIGNTPRPPDIDIMEEGVAYFLPLSSLYEISPVGREDQDRETAKCTKNNVSHTHKKKEPKTER